MRRIREKPSEHDEWDVSAKWKLAVLNKPYVRSFFSEALSADVEAILANESCAVSADAAASRAFTVGARTGIPDALVRHVC